VETRYMPSSSSLLTQSVMSEQSSRIIPVHEAHVQEDKQQQQFKGGKKR